jgi:AcrR family transcriptional regulator
MAVKKTFRPRENDLYKNAAHLFNKSGYSSTSIRQLCRIIGIRESSLYHYVRSKEELLLNICQNAMVVSLKAIEPIYTSDLPPDVKLKKMIEMHTSIVAEKLDEHFTMLKELRSLSAKNRENIIKLRDRYEDLFQNVIADCVRNKLFRKLDIKITTFALLGMMNSFIRWYSPEGSLEGESLAKIFSGLFFNGVRR